MEKRLKQYDVRIVAPKMPIRTVAVLARDSISALLHILEGVPQASCITVRRA